MTPGASTSAPNTPAAAASAALGDSLKAAQAKASDLKVTTSASLSDPAPPRTEPLIMENADHFEGSRSRGEYILSGKVRFLHGSLRIETEKAVWLKDRSLIYAESGMRISHRGSVLTADRGSYDKNAGQATAEGNVKMRDSSGEVEATGQKVNYLRFKHVATLLGNPEVRRFYRKAPDSSAAKDTASRVMKPQEISDTLSIKGTLLTYNDSTRIATAEGDVVIARKKVNITSKRAEFHDQRDSLYLVGDPVVRFDDSRVQGMVMRVGMNGEEIKSLLVKGDARALSVEPATDSSAARQSDVHGDSLFMSFRDKTIDSVQVFKNAKGSYHDLDKPDFVNRMAGDYMVLRFKEKKVSGANVLGKAKSTYFHLEKKALKGRNEAEGDTIDFAFKDGKVDEVLVRGQSKGTYFGEASRKKAGASASDSATPAGTPAPPASSPPVAAPAPAPERKQVDPAHTPHNPWRKK